MRYSDGFDGAGDETDEICQELMSDECGVG